MTEPEVTVGRLCVLNLSGGTNFTVNPDPPTKRRRSHEGSHGPARSRELGSLPRGPRPGREHRLDPGGQRCSGHLWNRRRDHLRHVRLGTPGQDRIILGHESLGRVADPGPDRSVQAGDLIVGIVRRPDPVPCPNCAVGEWDMCRNGQYTDRGIKEIDGFMSERWLIEPGYFTKVDPSLGHLAVLLEPTTVVAKAWELVGAMHTTRSGNPIRCWSPAPARSVCSRP